MEDTIFSKIIRREIPAHIVYEDEHSLAFLDTHPNSFGHTLVIPKKCAVNIFDIDDETLARVTRAARIVAVGLCKALGAKGVHLNSNHGAAAGQEVFHFHYHLIPRYDRGEFEFTWPHLSFDNVQADETAARIRAAVLATEVI